MRPFFPVAFALGAVLLLLGIWIFMVSVNPAPTVMGCGAATLALTALAWRGHRRARRAEAVD
ncbi:hypothetical protein HZY97_01700 [Sphingomonas sp. R-74633]|uniref:hypothetical protein n=1 Tax=Sphingomonas sp. R-74633 TaxID=2751188 RepID=UPI0015D3DA06|nr:hypothetical protein [Sphingomonas sp. R-74633]NYT39457.1 hypothetical protein [Sphingomonas sp. R-74633]